MNNAQDISILLIGHDTALQLALEEAGFRVEAAPESTDLYQRLARQRPDVVLVRADSPTRDTLEHLALLNRSNPQPTVLLHSGGDQLLHRAAIRHGISAYAIDQLSPALLRTLIDVSIAQFEHTRELKRELTRSQRSLAQRKLIDAAKCRLMESERLSEASAYSRLKDLAMNRRQSLVDAARALLADRSPQ